MKIKTYVITFHIVLLGVLIFFLYHIGQMEYRAVDVVTLNKQMKQVKEELDTMEEFKVSSTNPSSEDASIANDAENMEKVGELEDIYQCEITFIEDTDYMTALYHAYSNGDTIFDYLVEDRLVGKIIFPRTEDTFQKVRKQLQLSTIFVIVIVLVLSDLLLLILELRIFRPFRRLQKFATNVSSGNLDVPLGMDRHNYFGAFTESFDVMREELKAAREGEAKAKRSKKELVASLSHDIKTPVATIKALCEILEIKLNKEEAVTKIHTIQQKADLIDQLISNMFHATLSELEALKIEPGPEPSTILLPMFEDMNHYGKIKMDTQLPSCLVFCDRLRMTQVLDNIIGNSYKYAGTNIHVSFWESEYELFIKIQDEGDKLEEVDFALICEKFYRGNNVQGQSGSGLGLYLARMFMEGMKGSLLCENDHGFVVTLTLQKVGKRIEEDLRNG